MMAKVDKLPIDKLEGAKKRQIWKHQITAILEAKQLIRHIDGMLNRSVSSESTPGAIASFVKEQRKTKAVIVTSNKSDLICLIAECQTPKEIWGTLQKRFERDMIANKLYLNKDFSP